HLLFEADGAVAGQFGTVRLCDDHVLELRQPVDDLVDARRLEIGGGNHGLRAAVFQPVHDGLCPESSEKWPPNGTVLERADCRNIELGLPPHICEDAVAAGDAEALQYVRKLV